MRQCRAINPLVLPDDVACASTNPVLDTLSPTSLVASPSQRPFADMSHLTLVVPGAGEDDALVPRDALFLQSPTDSELWSLHDFEPSKLEDANENAAPPSQHHSNSTTRTLHWPTWPASEPVAAPSRTRHPFEDITKRVSQCANPLSTARPWGAAGKEAAPSPRDVAVEPLDMITLDLLEILREDLVRP